MKTGRIATRYAKALFDLAQEKNVLDLVYTDMLALYEICSTHRELKHLIASPIIPQHKKTAVFRELFFNNTHALSYGFLEMVIKKRREGLIDEIAHELIKLYKDFKNIKTVYLKTATKLDASLTSQITNRLEKELNSQVELIETVVPNLLGGFVVIYDDKQYDVSIRRNINLLKKEYNINIYESKF